MEIIRRGLILPEEREVAEKLKSFPDHWWCIAGDANRFSFRKGEGTQIDFLVISPKGIFLIDSKKVSLIERSEGNAVYFKNTKGKRIYKSPKRDNPVEDILDERYQAKDWLMRRGIEDFLTKDRHELKVFIHGVVVLANENTLSFENCNWDTLSYFSHKYPSLIPLSRLDLSYFDSLTPPRHCLELSSEEMWLLFKVFYNPELSLVQIFHQIKKGEEKFLQEKQIFSEKIELLEKENIQFHEKSLENEARQKNIESKTEEFQNKNQLLELELEEARRSLQEKDNSQKRLDLEQEKKYLSSQKDIRELDQQSNDLKDQNLKLNQEIDHFKQQLKEEREHQKERGKTQIVRSSFFYSLSYRGRLALIVSSFLVLLGFGWWIYSNQDKTKDSSVLSMQIFSSIEKVYPEITTAFEQKEYDKLLKLWQVKVLKEKDFNAQSLHQYDRIFFFVARSYEEEKAYENAIQYYDTYTELTENPKELLESYYHRSLSYIHLGSELDRAIFDLNQAREINTTHFDRSYLWEIQILWNLGLAYKMVAKELTPAKRDYYVNLLGLDNWTEEALKFYQEGRDLALKNQDPLSQVNFQSEIAHLYLFQKEFELALKEFQEVILVSESLEESSSSLEINMVAYNDLGVAYAYLGEVERAEESYLKALQLTKDNESILEEEKRKVYEFRFNQNLASLYSKEKRYQEAIEPLKKAYLLAKELNLPNWEVYEKNLQQIEELSKIN